MRKIHWMMIAGALALAGCGAAQTGGSGAAAQPTAAPATAVSAPTAAPAPTGAPATALPAPTAAPTSGAATGPTSEPPATPASPRPGAGGTSVRPPDALVGAAQQQLAAYLKLDPNAILLQSANQRDWPDAALGCPKPGMAYPQIVTSGFLLVFTDPAQTKSYEVHTGMSPAQIVLCENNQPVDLGAATAPLAGAVTDAAALDEAGRRALEQAQAALARELSIQPSEVTFVQAVAVEWRDSSLGCPKPNQNYMQVITPGYRLTVQAQGKQYEYHTDMGKRAIRCER